MELIERLEKAGLGTTNAIVIGSGILGALGIRPPSDIDLVVTDEAYNYLRGDPEFTIYTEDGVEFLMDDLLQVSTCWAELGERYNYANIYPHTVVIDGIRYITLGLLLEVKRRRLQGSSARQKDIDDVELIEAYFASRENGITKTDD